jgi:sortase A
VKVHVLHVRSTAGRFAQRFFLIAGLLALGFAAYSYAARYVYQAYENREFDRALSAKNAAPSPPAASEPTAGSRSLIGRIAIPRLGISAIVKEGIDDRTLGLAVGHIPSTAMPGERGNVGLAAHRDNLFRNLKDVKRDDEITLTTLDNTYVYRVASYTVVNPERVSVLAPSSGENTLTLVTCYPFYFVGHAPKRFVVRAVQVAGSPGP